MHLRVLVVESEPEDLLFLEEVLLEIEEKRQWHPHWGVETLAASTWMEAAALISREPVDVILLNPNLSDSVGAATFRRTQALAPHIPVIVLTEGENPDLAPYLVREGAQDFLNKKQIDCAPLSHAIRNAIERQRCLLAARARATSDPLTSLLNREAFLTLAARDCKLAESLRCRWLLMLGAPTNLSEVTLVSDEQRRDLALVDASDCLLRMAGSTALLGRISELRLALALFDTPVAPVEDARVRIHAAAATKGIAMGSAIFEPDNPVSLETLMEHAELDLAPTALAMRR